MKLTEVRTIIRNKLDALRRRRADCAAVGDLDQVVALDAEIADTEATLREIGG